MFLMDRESLMKYITEQSKSALDKQNNQEDKITAYTLSTRILLLVEINYIRMVRFVYENLKISPLIEPISLNDIFMDDLFNESKKEEEKELKAE